MPPATLDRLIQQARSDAQTVRSIALQELLAWVKKDPASHQMVLPVFRETLTSERDPRAVVTAVQGIELIVGGEEASHAWLKVLNDPDPAMVVMAAFTVNDPAFGPVLLELLARRPETNVRNAAICALGRLQYPEALPVIIARLAEEATRWAAIEALERLGDPRAIPHLEPFLHDQSALRGQDERGCEIDVRDITGYAIRRLQHLAKLKLEPPSAAAFGTRPKANFSAYLPLMLGLLEVPWIIIVMGLHSKPPGATTRAQNIATNHQLDLLAAIPVSAGLCIALAIIVRGTARRLPERLCLYLGIAICGAFFYALAREFFN